MPAQGCEAPTIDHRSAEGDNIPQGPTTKHIEDSMSVQKKLIVPLWL